MPDDVDQSIDHPYVAHYGWPDEHQTAPGRTERDDVERQLAIDDYLSRWRAPRYALGVLLACVSLGGGVYAAFAIAAAVSGGTASLVLNWTTAGQTSITLSGMQMTAVAVAMVALELLIVGAALLLFAKRTRRLLWLVVTIGAAIATAAFLVAWATQRQALLSLFSPISYAGPVILVAGLWHVHRAYGFRNRWGAEEQ